MQSAISLLFHASGRLTFVAVLVRGTCVAVTRLHDVDADADQPVRLAHQLIALKA